MARFENCKIEQYVENMTVERMVVGKMRVERQEVRNTEIQNPRNTEGFDLDFDLDFDSDFDLDSDYSPTLTEEQQMLFDKAVNAGLMKKSGTMYDWKKGSALLEYFCGRVFCGDRPSFDSRYGTTTWEKTSQEKLPSKKMKALFGQDKIGSYRNKRQGFPVPDSHKLVDALFK